MSFKRFLTITFGAALTLGMITNISIPSIVYAEELTDASVSKIISNEFVDDYETVGTTQTVLTDCSQMTEEQQNKYNQIISSKGYALEVGESMLIGADEEGEIYITCVSSKTDMNRAAWKTSKQSYNINKSILGVNTLLATVDLTCEWYQNGIDGYIKSLTGTYTKKNSLWSCSWDDNNKYATQYIHTLWLDFTSLGSSFSVSFTADYSPIDETLNFYVDTL